MMNTLRSICSCLLVLLAVIMAGCETTIGVDPPAHDAQLVVNSLFANEERWVVEVSASAGAFDASDIDDSRYTVDDATVMIRAPEQDTIPLSYTDTLTYRTPFGERQPIGPAYVASQPVPRTGQAYTLRVEAPDYEAVEAQSRIPERIPMSVSSTARRVPLPPDITPGVVRQRRTVRLRIDDPPNMDNAYRIRALRVDSIDTRTVWSPAYFTTRSPSILDKAPADYLEGDTSYTSSSAYFNDVLFDGRTQQVDLVFEESFQERDGSVNRRSHIVLHVAALSEQMYKYFDTSRAVDDTDDNPFAEPINIFSNVEGGYGIFAGRHERMFSHPFQGLVLTGIFRVSPCFRKVAF